MARAITIKGKVASERKVLSTRLLFLIVFTLALALGYIHIKVSVLRLGYEISKERGKEGELLRQNRLLHAEHIELKSPARIEGIAKKLGFRFPTEEDVVYIGEEK